MSHYMKLKPNITNITILTSLSRSDSSLNKITNSLYSTILYRGEKKCPSRLDMFLCLFRICLFDLHANSLDKCRHQHHLLHLFPPRHHELRHLLLLVLNLVTPQSVLVKRGETVDHCWMVSSKSNLEITCYLLLYINELVMTHKVVDSIGI